MKNLFTSYFSSPKIRDLQDDLKFSIAAKSIKGFKVLSVLAPPGHILWAYKSRKLTEEEYRKQYLKYLFSIHRTGVLEKTLLEIPEYSILLCYEKTGSFCHRNILAEYINDEFDNFAVSEL